MRRRRTDGSAALAAFLLFGAYFERVADKLYPELPPEEGLGLAFKVDLAQPEVFAGGLLGAMLVFLFASLAIRAVGKAAHEMINEVRRQFKADPGIMEKTSKPDYAKCVDIATKGALKAMGKKTNHVATYVESAKKLRGHGIGVLGSFVLGWDGGSGGAHGTTAIAAAVCWAVALTAPSFH